MNHISDSSNSDSSNDTNKSTISSNPHLGLINASPPLLLFSSKRPFSLYIYYQQGQKYTKKYGQDFINHISPLMGGPPLRE